MDLGLGIRLMLARKKMSQTKLAKAVSVTRPYMCSLCNNERVPSFGLLEEISKALDCELWELIKECK
jgi:transcriptional regulator with XRE-family HTH domain